MADDIRVNLSATFSSTVLRGKINNPDWIWTGIIDSKLVDGKLIADSSARRELKNLIKEYEIIVKNFRNNTDILKFNDETRQLEVLMNKIYERILKYADIELYLIYIINKFDMMKKENPEEFKKISEACKKEMQESKKILLEQDRIYSYVIYSDELNQYRVSTECLREQKKLIREDNAQKLVKLVHAVSPESNMPEEEEYELLCSINSKITIPDMLATITRKELVHDIHMVLLRNYLLKSGIPYEDVNEFSDERLMSLTSDIHLYTDSDEYQDAISDTLVMHIEYMDMEALALTYIFRHIDEFNASMLASFEVDEIIQDSKALYEMSQRILKSGIITNRSSAKIITVEGEETILTLKTINSTLKEFVDGVYLTDNTRNKMKRLLLFGNSTLENCSDELIKGLDFSRFETEVISLINFENLHRFYESNIIDKDVIEHMVRICQFDVFESLKSENNEEQTLFDQIEPPKKIDLVSFLYTSQIIDENDIFKFYMSNEITLEEIDELKLNKMMQELKSNLIKSLKPEILVGAYQDFTLEYLNFINLSRRRTIRCEKFC